MKSTHPKDGGAEGIRTPDPHNAIVVLYQLSYDPIQSGKCRALDRIVKTILTSEEFPSGRSVFEGWCDREKALLTVSEQERLFFTNKDSV